MKLTVDFSPLHQAITQLGNVVTDFVITSSSSELGAIGSHLLQGLVLGEDLQLEDVDCSNGILTYQGHHVMLYIADQSAHIETILANGKQGKKVHVAECRTLSDMRAKGRFERYHVISRTDGIFPVFGYDPVQHKHHSGDTDLGVCRNCLTLLNYQGYDTKDNNRKMEIFSRFTFEKFFETYSSYFKQLPESKVNKSGQYTADWSSISSRLRSELNYTCEQCGVDLNGHAKLLHTHHISGNKADNRRENLRVLCADCHKKQPHHGHLHVAHEDILIINRLRREQYKSDVFDYAKVEQWSDSALIGLVAKCKESSVPVPELGMVINDGRKMIALDLCWPRRKVAVVIDLSQADNLREKGWTVLSAFDALNRFFEFQKAVR